MKRDVEEVRAAALAHLGVRDGRAREILAHATITIEADDARWEASHGDFGGVRVVLGTDARALGAITALPAIHDALCDALAAAVSAPGVSMTSFVARWTSASPAHAYRGSRDVDVTSDDAIAEALVEFFEGAGESERTPDAIRRATALLRAR